MLQGSEFSLDIAPGGTATFTVSNSQPCEVNFAVGSAVVSGGPWLSASPAGGTIPAQSSAFVTVSVNAALLPPDEGTYFGTVTVIGPNNSFTVQVTTTRGGQPPVVQSVTGQCLTTAVGAIFTATITDDVAMWTATVYFTASGGTNHQVDLANSSGNSWTGTITGVSARSGSNFRVVAIDASGKQTTQSFAAPC